MVNSTYKQKNLPSYSSYIASKQKTPNLEVNSGMPTNQKLKSEQSKQNFHYNKSKSFDAGHLEHGKLISAIFFRAIQTRVN